MTERRIPGSFSLTMRKLIIAQERVFWRSRNDPHRVQVCFRRPSCRNDSHARFGFCRRPHLVRPRTSELPRCGAFLHRVSHLFALPRHQGWRYPPARQWQRSRSRAGWPWQSRHHPAAGQRQPRHAASERQQQCYGLFQYGRNNDDEIVQNGDNRSGATFSFGW